MIAVPFLSMLSVPSEGAVSATGGSGTADDPYSGIISGSLTSINGSDVVYVEVGSTFENVNCGDPGEMNYTILHGADNFGLTTTMIGSREYYTGVITSPGATIALSGHSNTIMLYTGTYRYSVIFVDDTFRPHESSLGTYYITSLYYDGMPQSSQDLAYEGVVIRNMSPSGVTDVSETIYAYQGAYIDITLTEDISIAGDVTGLVVDGRTVSGYLNGSGQLSFNDGSFIIEVVGAVEPLEFLSDPTGGTIQFIGS